MIKEAIAKLMNKENLSYEEARQVMDEIMDGKVSPTLISSYLTALSMKGETTDEISGSAYWRPWASTSPCPRKSAGNCWRPWASASCLPRPITAP